MVKICRNVVERCRHVVKRGDGQSGRDGESHRFAACDGESGRARKDSIGDSGV